MLKYFAILITLLVLTSCDGPDNERSVKDPAASVDVQTGGKTAASVFPSAVDSLEVVFYKKPFTDSTRYYRFFRVAITSDSTTIREMNQVLAEASEKRSEVKKCLSEGKLIVPLGGEAYRTVYFSRLETFCPYLYYIEDGAFYYYEISPALNEKLNLLEKLAVEPE